ncbi:MAG: hypothetical protein BWY16_00165 [Candidatus Omnitrophica bacterium ADurb.Bin205]|nr:MAG: hypothetical protein BWY16_00165 [Candidatus Omnitrophica bacterium ADurb.Bin205]
MSLKFTITRRGILGLFIVLFVSQYAFGASPTIPLPADVELISEKTANIGPSQSVVSIYESALSLDRLSSFFKKEMARAGWVEQKQGFYMKDGYLAMVVFMPSKVKGAKVRFTVNSSRIPSKEEVLAASKDRPDKLNFMPVYPGSKQLFLWDLPTGVSASYETEKDIKDVVFFYKSGMLNYGWSLVSETPISMETVNIDCPDCQKSQNKATPSSALRNVNMSKANLTFRRKDGEKCTIRIFQSTPGPQGLMSVNPDSDQTQILLKKTSILVTYYAGKN